MPLERNLLEQGFWYFARSQTHEIQVFPRNPPEIFPNTFPVESAAFSKNLPLKILRNLTFLPWKSHKIGRFFREFWLFSRENPAKSADFSMNLPLKIPRNFAFFPQNIRSPVRSLDVVSPQNLPVIHSSVITRCRSCRTYINPFVTFTDSRRWRCPMCFRVNEGMSLQDPSYPFYIMEQYTLQAPLFDLILLWYQTNDHSYGNS